MCRFAGLMAPTDPTDPAAAPPLSSLLLDPPHSLERQAYAPSEQRRIRDDAVNVDGTGVAWWADDAPEPLRYATEKPVWGDANLPWLAPRLRSAAQIALVRAATPGIPHGTNFVSPFVYRRWAGAHNGWLGAFREHTARRVLDRLPDHLFAAYHAASDSLALFLTVMRHLEADPAGDLVGAVAATCAEAAEVCRAAGAQARVNLLVGDGERLVAARTAVDLPADSMFVLEGGRRWPGAALVASEPLDDDAAWTPVPEGCVVELGPGAVRAVEPLAALRPAA